MKQTLIFNELILGKVGNGRNVKDVKNSGEKSNLQGNYGEPLPECMPLIDKGYSLQPDMKFGYKSFNLLIPFYYKLSILNLFLFSDGNHLSYHMECLFPSIMKICMDPRRIMCLNLIKRK
jgi:hypothetical protein